MKPCSKQLDCHMHNSPWMERWPDLRDCAALEECWPKSLVRRSIDRRFAVVVFQFFSNTISFRRATFPPAQAIHFGVLQLTIYWSLCWSSRTGYRDLNVSLTRTTHPIYVSTAIVVATLTYNHLILSTALATLHIQLHIIHRILK